MPNINRPKRSGVSATTTKVSPLPDAPTVVLADTGYDNSALVTLTTPTGGAPDTYTVTTSPGSFTSTGISPLTFTGLTTNVNYTFSATGTNGTGTSATSTGTYTPGMHKSFNSIATVTVGAGGQSTITFSSIPQTYTHLQIRMSAPTNATNANLSMQFNGDTSANYSRHEVKGDGGSAGSFASAPDSFIHVGYSISGSTSSPYISIIDVLDYTNTNKYKTTRSLNGIDVNGSGGIVMLTSGNWRNTAAITSITITCSTFQQYSSFALYGVA